MTPWCLPKQNIKAARRSIHGHTFYDQVRVLPNLDFICRQGCFALFAVAVRVGLQVAKGLKRVTSNVAYCEQHYGLPIIVWKRVLFSLIVSPG